MIRLTLVLLLFALPSQAQGLCTTRADILKQLARGFSEAPVAMGITTQGGVVELLMSRGGKTWTIIVSLPTGITCPVVAGENWITETPIRGTKL